MPAEPERPFATARPIDPIGYRRHEARCRSSRRDKRMLPARQIARIAPFQVVVCRRRRKNREVDVVNVRRCESEDARSAARSQPALADRRLEGEPGVPGKEDPGVLRHFGDEGVDQRPAHRLGIDGGEMRLAAGSRAPACAVLPVSTRSSTTSTPLPRPPPSATMSAATLLEHAQLALGDVVVARDAHGLDHADAELARHDRRRHQPAARDRTRCAANGPASASRQASARASR